MDPNRLGPRGQIVIPHPIRKALGLETGDFLQATLEDGKVVFRPVTITVRPHNGETMATATKP